MERSEKDFAERVRANQRRLSSEIGRTFDYIVCGAGTSGSVVAARLAANPNVRVLLLEAGGSDETDIVMDPNQWPHGGALSRCYVCLRQDVDAGRVQRRERMARATRTGTMETEPTKICRRCKVMRPLSEFARHARARDGRRRDCSRCVKTGRTVRRTAS